MSDRTIYYTRLSIALAILSILVTILIGIAAIRSSKELAEKSGALDKPSVEAHIGYVRLTDTIPTKIIFGVDSAKHKEGLVIAPFTLAFKNSGKINLRNVYVSFRYPKMLKRDVLENLSSSVTGAFMEKDI